MQLSKKLFTAAITTLLVLSTLATIVPTFAITTATLSRPDGPVGTTVYIGGAAGSAQPGGAVDVFWENTGGLLLKSGYASGDGAYNVSVTIPDSAAGTHFLIARDSDGNIGAPFIVTPSITVSPTRGILGDSINVTGSGFSGNSTSAARNVTVTIRNDTTIIGGTYVRNIGGVNASSTGNFSLLVTVPVIDYGSYVINATDQATSVHTAGTTFTVGASIIMSPTSGPSGTVVTLTGRGFSSIAGLNVTVSVGTTSAVEPTQILTVADGTFAGTFIVPTLAVSSTRYTVAASDPNFTATLSGSSTTTGGFRVTGTTALIANPTSAAPGSTVTLTGVNFTAIAGTTVTVRFGNTPAGTMELTTFTTNSSGGFSGPITVPSLPTGAGYYINGTDANRLNATTTFSIAITALFLSPTIGATGSVVTMTGYGLGITGGTTFNVTLDGTLLTPTSNTVASLSAGTAQISIPTISTGAKTIVVMDNLGLSATATFTVTATSTLLVNPTTGPVGVTGVALTLSNFGAGVTVAFFIANSTNTYALTVAPGTGFSSLVTNSSRMLTGTFTVPTLALGAYTIKANETSGNWNATAAFTIGEATLTINTRALTYFQGNTISFNIQSSFAGDLQINVYDPTGIPTALVFPYYAFVPMGSLYVIPYAYPGLAITAYTFGLALPSDATTGTWFWNTTFIGLTRNGTFTVVASAAASTVTNTDLNSTLTQILRDLANMNTTLLSTINASVISINGNVATISTSIGTLTTTVNAIGANVTSIKGTVATIQTSIGTLQTTVTAINASLVGINNGFATVQTSVGTLTTSVSSISSTLSGVSGTVGTISSSVGSLTTSLSSIGTTVTSINGNVATIKTDLGTLSGTVTTISNGVATIQTGIGTLQADVSSLTTDVSNVPGQISIPIWVAVVLALIAALAAIASLLLVRRKIAG